MEFVTLSQLARDVDAILPRLPRDVRVVVGIPRSGILVATMIALKLDGHVTDLRAWCQGPHFWGAGRRMQRGRGKVPGDPRRFLEEGGRVLLVDDAAWSGRSIRRARKAVALAHARRPGSEQRQVTTLVMYTSPRCRGLVDLQFRELPSRRMYEWNLWTHHLMARSLVDMDGVLCVDPEPRDDDGPEYEAAIRDAVPLYLPPRVGGIVTNRLERWRWITAEWLARWGVRYESLTMSPHETADARRAAGHYGRWKGSIYAASEAPLFVESSLVQAKEIAKHAKRPVICVEDWSFHP